VSRGVRLAGWLALALVVVWMPGGAPPPRTASLAERLLGPVAGLGASAQWVRVGEAFRQGRPELALARAETALRLDPRSVEGWKYLADRLAYDLAAPSREPDSARRLAWVRAGIATLARGEAHCRDPGELALQQGLILWKVAVVDPELAWPSLAEEARAHFARAASLGHPEAAALVRAIDAAGE